MFIIFVAEVERFDPVHYDKAVDLIDLDEGR